MSAKVSSVFGTLIDQDAAITGETLSMTFISVCMAATTFGATMMDSEIRSTAIRGIGDLTKDLGGIRSYDLFKIKKSWKDASKITTTISICRGVISIERGLYTGAMVGPAAHSDPGGT